MILIIDISFISRIMKPQGKGNSLNVMERKFFLCVWICKSHNFELSTDRKLFFLFPHQVVIFFPVLIMYKVNIVMFLIEIGYFFFSIYINKLNNTSVYIILQWKKTRSHCAFFTSEIVLKQIVKTVFLVSLTLFF